MKRIWIKNHGQIKAKITLARTQMEASINIAKFKRKIICQTQSILQKLRINSNKKSCKN